MPWRFLALVAILLCLSLPASAFKISPFKMTLRTDGNEKTHVLRVDNNSSESIAVQVSALTWLMTRDGREENTDAESDFVIFPAQLVLPPHESRAVRIQYVGPPVTGPEKAYRLVAEQLPVTLKDTAPSQSAVKFMLKFKAALYVAGGKGESAITRASWSEPKPGLLRLTLVNKGQAHGVIKNAVVKLKTDAGPKDIPSSGLATLEGQNIHAGSTRDIDIKLPLGLARVTHADLHFEAGY